MSKTKHQDWLDKQDWDMIYKLYLENAAAKPILEAIQSPYRWEMIRFFLKKKGYKIRSKTESNNFRNETITWDDKKRLEHSKIMHNVVKDKPEQYLGRYRGRKMQTFEDIDYLGNKCTHLGTWEKLIADLLTENNIKWLKEIYSFEYQYKNTMHLYYPDFYLPDYKLYIEVKGYETERDLAKWRNFPAKLFIIKGDALIRKLMNRKISILDVLNLKTQFCN